MDKNTKPGKRRKAGWVVLTILLILIAAGAGLWQWQKNNIDAVMQYTQYSQDELEQKLEENDRQVQDILDAALNAAREYDAQQSQPGPEQEPVKGATDSSAGGGAEPSPTPSGPGSVPVASTPVGEPEPTPVPPPQDEGKVPTYEEQLLALVERVYDLRDEYLAALDSLQSEAVAAYREIPSSERTKSKLVRFASTYISKATNLEKECDKKMNALVAELEKLQKQYGQSMELVEQVIYTYANEKSLKKAWYMSELESRGMI